MSLGGLANQVGIKTPTLTDAINGIEQDLVLHGFDLNKFNSDLTARGIQKGTEGYLNYLKDAQTKLIPGSNANAQNTNNTSNTTTNNTSLPSGLPPELGPLYAAPAESDIEILTQSYIKGGLSPDLARKAAENDLTKQATTQAQSKFDVTAANTSIQSFLDNLPQQNEKMYNDLNTKLSDYQKNFYGQTMEPLIYQQQAARGLSGGALDTALANSIKQLETQREGTLAPLISQQDLASQQMQYENALRQAQTAGSNAAELTQYGQGLQSQNYQNLYNTGYQNTQNQYNQQMQNQNYLNQKNLMDYQNQMNNQNAYSQGLGNLLGLGARTILGGVLGPTFGITSGQGAAAGFTGNLSPNWWK